MAEVEVQPHPVPMTWKAAPLVSGTGIRVDVCSPTGQAVYFLDRGFAQTVIDMLQAAVAASPLVIAREVLPPHPNGGRPS